MIHLLCAFQSQVKWSSRKLWFIIIPAIYNSTVERNVISPGLQRKSPLICLLSWTFCSLSVNFLCVLSAGGFEEVFVGKEKVEKTFCGFHMLLSLVCGWILTLPWGVYSLFLPCPGSKISNLSFLFLSFFFFHFRMSWTSQRSTERPCLPYQQKRNGRYTAARRRLELSNIRSLCVCVWGGGLGGWVFCPLILGWKFSALDYTVILSEQCLNISYIKVLNIITSLSERNWFWVNAPYLYFLCFKMANLLNVSINLFINKLSVSNDFG